MLRQHPGRALEGQDNVRSNVVRELRGSLEVDQRRLIITSSGFSRDAIEEVIAPGKTPISLSDGEKPLGLLIENELGVTHKSVQYLELSLSDLEDLGTDVSTDEQRYLSIWPLPGGTDRYVETAKEFLRFVAVNEPDIHAMKQWIKSEYPKVTSDGSIRGYLSVLRNLDLINYDGEIIKVTNAGAEALRGSAREVIKEQLEKRISGIKELEERIGPEGITEEETLEFLKEELGVNWESAHQARFRLLWLTDVGTLRRQGNRYYPVT